MAHRIHLYHRQCVLIIQLTNSSPNVLKVSNTLITRQQCPELLSAWWLMTISLRQYCFSMISNRATWTATNTQNKLEHNLWIKHRASALLLHKLNCSGQNTDADRRALSGGGGELLPDMYAVSFLGYSFTYCILGIGFSCLWDDLSCN